MPDILYPILTKIWIFFRLILMRVCSLKFYGNPSSGIRTATREWSVEMTNRHEETKGGFSRLDFEAPESG